jgi:50S ribosomal protein L16 3-hydroxylase
VAEFAGLLSPAALMRLACREDARARVVVRDGRRWDVHHGPFRRAFFRTLAGRRWTLLVQDVNHHLPEGRALLERFSFIPYARLDDLMVSYAPPGGGVGPHFDSYDVFLLQGMGRRRWRISRQRDLDLVADAPLKILRRFRPEQEWVLHPGDMLYLPPACAHDGVAVDECMTYSIGFRAPTWQELSEQFLVHLQDRLVRSGVYTDADLIAQTNPGRIGSSMIDKVASQLEKIRWSRADVVRFLGGYLTEPKPHVFFSPPSPPLPLAAFRRCAISAGLTLDLRTQLLYAGDWVFINGECVQAQGVQAQELRLLADRRAMRLSDASDPGLVRRLHEWYRAGYVTLGVQTDPEAP